ncbi:hypothetical protein HYDPIDRAFT_140820, partial [Hydnomerulius pinastri MD-312]
MSSIDPSHPNAKGVAIVINKHITNTSGIKLVELVPGRALLATIPWHREEHLNVLNVYAPNEPATNETFWTEVLDKLQGQPRPDVLLGDFNMIEDALDRLPPHMDARPAMDAMCKLKSEMHLVDGWRAENPDSTAFTFSQSRAQGGRQSRIDRIYIQQDALIHTKDWKIDPSGIPTDHQLVSARISDRRMPYVGKGRWTLPIFILNDKNVTTAILSKGIDLQREIEESKNNRSDIRNPQTLFKAFKDEAIQICRSEAKKAIPKIQQRMNTLKANLKSTLADSSLSEEERR